MAPLLDIMEKKIEKVMAPISLRNITKGKEYEIERIDNKSFFLQDDNDTKQYCLFVNCGFIGGQDWHLVKEVSLTKMKRGEEYYFDKKLTAFGKFVKRSGAIYLFETEDSGAYHRDKLGFVGFMNVKQKFILKSN